MKTNKDKEYEHEITMTKLSHTFAMKMATMISLSVVSVIIILGICSVDVITPTIISIIALIAVFLGIISFRFTRTACL